MSLLKRTDQLLFLIFCSRGWSKLSNGVSNRLTTLSEPLLNQHAYTRGRSTETALEDVVFYLERYRIKDRFTMAASLDCSGAFDNVTFDSSKRALTRHRLPPGITSWYIHLLENRRVTSELYGTPRTISPTVGTPQGGGSLPHYLESDH